MGIKIHNVRETETLIAVVFEFDNDGKRRQINFGLDITEEQIQSTLEYEYSKFQSTQTDEEKKRRKELIKKLKGKEF